MSQFIRFQKTADTETSYHVYPDSHLLNYFANPSQVLEEIKKNPDVDYHEFSSEVDIDLFNLKPGYVCAEYFDECNVLSENNQKFNSNAAAYDEHVIIFESEDSTEIFDGYIARVDKIKAIYKRNDNRTYDRIK